MAFSSGERLGPYEILNQLGAGGMGDVYKARDTRLGREVAIKVSHEQFTERFDREARAVAALNHSNICHLYDVGPNYIVMELVNGIELQGPVDLETALHYGRQICDALEAAHEKGIVHRDLKPANINVKPDGSLKVLDFGLAKTMDELAGDPNSSPTMTMSTTRAGMILGTAAYMSPEQARGKQVDKRTDIWAFGCVLYESLTGEQAFQGETISDLLAAVLREEPDLTKVPAQIRPILARCFAKDPRKRWRDIGDVRIALDETQLTPAPIESAAPAVAARAPLIPWAIAGLLGLTLAAVLFFLWPHAAQAPTLLRLPVALGPDAQVRGTYATLAISPDGSHIVLGEKDADGAIRLALRPLDQPKAIPLAGTEGARDPFFSPDGQWIAFAAANKLKKISAQGGSVAVLCDAPNFRGGWWGPDGFIVAALDTRSVLSRIPEEGGAPEKIGKLEPPESSERWPQVLPNGNILFTSMSIGGDPGSASVVALSPKTGRRTILQKNATFGRYVSSGHLVFARGEGLLAVRMNPEKLETSGSPTDLVEGLIVALTGWAGFFPSDSGTAIALASESDHLQAIYWETDSNLPQLIARYPGAYSLQLSPDGGKLAVSVHDNAASDIWIYDLARDTRTRITFDGGSDAPHWSPDGQYVAYVNRRKQEAWAVRADGAGEPSQLYKGTRSFQIESFTPDGKQLLITMQDANSGSDIWSMQIDRLPSGGLKAQEPKVVLKTPFNEQSAALSPDGKWIAYVSDESGNREVYVSAFPGPGGRWQISTSGGDFPLWSRKGNQLFFVSGDRMMAAAYRASGQSFNADKPVHWSERQFLNPSFYRLFDLNPDGKRFVRLRPFGPSEIDDGEQEATFLVNFLDELKRRIPVK